MVQQQKFVLLQSISTGSKLINKANIQKLAIYDKCERVQNRTQKSIFCTYFAHILWICPYVKMKCKLLKTRPTVIFFINSYRLLFNRELFSPAHQYIVLRWKKGLKPDCLKFSVAPGRRNMIFMQSHKN